MAQDSIQQKIRIIKLSAVMKRVPLSRSAIYDGAKRGTFPAPVKIGPRASGFLENEIDEWINKQIAKSRQNSCG